MTAAIAPPAENPATYTRLVSTLCVPMTWRLMPAMSDGSPAPVAGLEPVPVPHGVGRGRLLRVGDQEGVAFRQLVHGGARREVADGLRTTVQHDDQRYALPVVAGRHVQLVRAGSGRAGVREGE